MTSDQSAGSQAGLEETADVFSSISKTSDTPLPDENPRFESLGLSPEVLKAVSESGYTTPTPIQAQGIPHVLARRDIIGIAQTGTGKTASFTLPMIEILARGRSKARMPRSLILEPTRELAAQVAESFGNYSKHSKLSMALLIGGTSFEDQDRKLDRGVDVLIATPGRLLDHFERGKLMLSQVQVLVIDEADRMLDMGFIPDVERICKLTPFTRQTLFYSATMPSEIQRLTEQFLSNPVRVEVARPATAADTITQEIVEIPHNDWAKREALRRLVREGDVKNAIVFCNRKRDVDVVARSLSKHGFSAAPLHGDLDQSVRTKTLDAFKSGEVQLLVASDVAARGLDIPAVSHVFNFDVPIHADDYVHRIGRTGRAGRSGQAYMLVSRADQKYVDAIERLTGIPIARRAMEGIEIREDLGSKRRERGERGRDRTSKRGHDRRREPAVASPEAAPQQVAVPDEPKPETQQTSRAKDKTPRRPSAVKNQAVQQQRPPLPANVACTEDAAQLPAFLLRPINLPKAEKPAPRTKKTEAKLDASV
jgi:superfamily II DNA/RNA helicase